MHQLDFNKEIFISRMHGANIKIMFIGVYVGVKYPLFLSDFNETWILQTDFRNILKYQISLKSVQWEPNYSMRTDRKTDIMADMTKLIVAFSNFANAPKNRLYS